MVIIIAEIWLEQVQYRMPQQEVKGESRERFLKVEKDLKRDLEVF